MPTEDEARLDALTEQQDAEVLAAERAAAAAAAGPTTAQLTAITAAVIVAWEATDDEDEHSRLLAALRARLLGIDVSSRRVLLSHFLRAFGLGRKQAYRQLGRRDRLPGSGLLPRDVVAAAEGSEDAARRALVDAARMLAGVQEVSDLEDALSRARGASTAIERAATWGVNRSIASGVTEVAEAEQTSRLWIGERDACLHCLAYFGQIAGPGQDFPTGLTFGKKPLDGPVPNPPLHPHCRCRITVWVGEWRSPGDGGYPEALKREARRSVARGWSLPSESNRSRVDAAERLLRRGAGLPKTVQEYAARAVRTGKFPRGRVFPD